jgi:hypothetical protein
MHMCAYICVFFLTIILVLGTDADKLVYIHIDIRVKRDIPLRISTLMHVCTCIYAHISIHVSPASVANASCESR